MTKKGLSLATLACLVAPALELKDDRSDVQAVRQAAGALGLKLVYKRDLLARLRVAHGPDEKHGLAGRTSGVGILFIPALPFRR